MNLSGSLFVVLVTAALTASGVSASEPRVSWTVGKAADKTILPRRDLRPTAATVQIRRWDRGTLRLSPSTAALRPPLVSNYQDALVPARAVRVDRFVLRRETSAPAAAQPASAQLVTAPVGLPP